MGDFCSLGAVLWGPWIHACHCAAFSVASEGLSVLSELWIKGEKKRGLWHVSEVLNSPNSQEKHPWRHQPHHSYLTEVAASGQMTASMSLWNELRMQNEMILPLGFSLYNRIINTAQHPGALGAPVQSNAAQTITHQPTLMGNKFYLVGAR